MDGKEKKLTELVGAKPLLQRHHPAWLGLAWMRVACMSFFELILESTERVITERKREREKEECREQLILWLNRKIK